MLTLHRYYLWAYRMRAHLAEIGERPVEPGPELQRWKIASFQYGGLWLSLLYVVVEGWRAMGFSDVIVDDLLHSSHVESLRRLRNALFHFQPEYTDVRVGVFFGEDPAPVSWAAELHHAFDRWFRKQMEKSHGH